MQKQLADQSRLLAEVSRACRFSVVGVTGFLVDAAILLFLVEFLGLAPIPARIFSFSVAVLVTFALHKQWSFGSLRHQKLSTALATYLAVQGIGFTVNFAIYATAISVSPPPFNEPLFALAVASLGALIVNYAGARGLVFGTFERKRDQ